MRRLVCLLAMFALAGPLIVVSAVESGAQIRRRNELPLVPRSHGRRQADRQWARQQSQVYVPGHFVWDNRRGQYSWIGGRWERYDTTHAFVGAGLQFRNGQWTAGPAR